MWEGGRNWAPGTGLGRRRILKGWGLSAGMEAVASCWEGGGVSALGRFCEGGRWLRAGRDLQGWRPSEAVEAPGRLDVGRAELLPGMLGVQHNLLEGLEAVPGMAPLAGRSLPEARKRPEQRDEAQQGRWPRLPSCCRCTHSARHMAG